MNASVIFDPLVPWWALWVALGFAVALTGLAAWRGLRGWWLRGLSLVVVLAALAGPSAQREDRVPLPDIVIAVVDDSASQRLSDRPAQTQAALDRLRSQVATMGGTQLRVVHLADAPDNGGTQAMAALAQAMADEPRDRIAGAVLISDGQVHDMQAAPDLPAPLHLLQTGHASDWDRRLVVSDAPAFAIIGEEARLTLRVEDQGQVPANAGTSARLTLTLGAEEPVSFDVPVGQDLELPIRLPHGGMNVLQLAVEGAEGEITDRNNARIVQINGVRDRLRVLLVSGEPHAGERVWRNLLKSDPSVDLVHFTILRPPEKQDGTPVSELSLVAFPTRELFMEKIRDFDLIIFDRYRLRGILPGLYLQNVRDYVVNGGTVLVAAGPEFAGVESLARSPLGEIMPVRATGRVLEEGFRPVLSALGQRHPVTEGLEQPENWGRWFRQIELEQTGGEELMQGIGGRPLLVLDRVGQGRIAVLGSDQLWLWGRGFEGGGPQLELTRRLAHWMLKEPELEEEALTATVSGEEVTIHRRTVADEAPPPVTITGPDGTETALPLVEEGPGRFAATWQAPQLGLYRMRQDDLAAVFAVGPAAPREFDETIASADRLMPVMQPLGGGPLRLEDHANFTLRQVGEGRVAVGRGWIGVTPRGAYDARDVTVAPLLPAWLWLVAAAALMLGAWLREGRFTRRVS
ncbi:glutamine amidotransferase [Falsirhodobacter deserti]|uniref:glutamine amidotransferase n=1 Tax=Falsirhodobacter deserti TaxID=1365611 RepID=UPI000FE379CC|nr:glutamine amidotransferase [Falsirhodobacter deserti]